VVKPENRVHALQLMLTVLMCVGIGVLIVHHDLWWAWVITVLAFTGLLIIRQRLRRGL